MNTNYNTNYFPYTTSPILEKFTPGELSAPIEESRESATSSKTTQIGLNTFPSSSSIGSTFTMPQFSSLPTPSFSSSLSTRPPICTTESPCTSIEGLQIGSLTTDFAPIDSLFPADVKAEQSTDEDTKPLSRKRAINSIETEEKTCKRQQKPKTPLEKKKEKKLTNRELSKSCRDRNKAKLKTHGEELDAFDEMVGRVDQKMTTSGLFSDTQSEMLQLPPQRIKKAKQSIEEIEKSLKRTEQRAYLERTFDKLITKTGELKKCETLMQQTINALINENCEWKKRALAAEEKLGQLQPEKTRTIEEIFSDIYKECM